MIIHEPEESTPGIEGLLRLARYMGATDAAVISTDCIFVLDRLAALCLEPRCPGYGMSAGCPPHVSGPAGFRELVKGFHQALVFKIEVPSNILLSAERRDIFRLLHEIAAALELSAVRAGLTRSRAFAGGSCKELFCPDKAECRVTAGGACRNPDRARPSMSGFGIDVSRLMEGAGWPMNRAVQGGRADNPSTGTVSGLLLIG